MNETHSSQAQHGIDFLRKLAEEQLTKLGSVSEEAARIEATVTQGVSTAIHEGARLFTDSMTYAAQLSGEWRKLSLDALRRANELFAAKN